MKKKLLVLVALLLMIMPICAFAKENKEYVTMNLKETVESEGLVFANEGYKEKDEQAIIYLFRGNGCSYCKALITYLNDLSVTHGKYFKLVSYEVWGEQRNSELLQEVGEFLQQDVGGVPFVVIGDKAFPGYSEGMNQEIEKAIMELYESKEKYDVLEELEKEKIAEKRREMFETYGIPAIFSLVFSVVAVIVATVINKKQVATLKVKVEQLEAELKATKEHKHTEVHHHKNNEEHKPVKHHEHIKHNKK